jgi:hypothetical protein
LNSNPALRETVQRSPGGFPSQINLSAAVFKEIMMNIFLIEIGRMSRRGNFEQLFHKVVSASDNCAVPQVKHYFDGKYEGFEIRVSHIEEIADLSGQDITGNCNKKEEESHKSYIHDFRVKYTEHEEKLHKEYREHQEKANRAVSDLHNSIENRFNKLYYSDICNCRPIKLRTDYFYTYCDEFPINGFLFEDAAQKAEEGFTPDE